MGCFDSVMVPCPDCKRPLEFQSKSGDCSLSSYTLEDAPADVMTDVNRHAPICCECGAAVVVDPIRRRALCGSVGERIGDQLRSCHICGKEQKVDDFNMAIE